MGASIPDGLALTDGAAGDGVRGDGVIGDGVTGNDAAGVTGDDAAGDGEVAGAVVACAMGADVATLRLGVAVPLEHPASDAARATTSPPTHAFPSRLDTAGTTLDRRMRPVVAKG